MELGRISAIFRYPVKSMAGELLDVARLSWHGIEGDRRLAFRRLTDKSGFPWLTASKLPQVLLYKPLEPATISLEELEREIDEELTREAALAWVLPEREPLRA